MIETTTDPAKVEPLSDDGLRQLRVLLSCDVNCITASTVRALIERHDDAHGEIGALQAEIIKAHGAIQAALRRAVAAEAVRDTVWWLEGDNEYAEPDVYATQQLALDAALREFRTANFPALQDAAHDWQPEEHGDGLELLVAGERTRLIVRQLTVRTTVGPLESVVTEALADIATTPADPEPAPPAPPWLVPAGDD